MSLFAECWVFSRSVDLYLFHPFLQRIVRLTRRREEAKSRLKWRAFKAARKILIQDQYCPSSRLSWHRPPYQMDCRISWVPLKGTLSLLHWGKVLARKSVSHATSKLNELRLLTTGNLQFELIFSQPEFSRSWKHLPWEVSQFGGGRQVDQGSPFKRGPVFTFRGVQNHSHVTQSETFHISIDGSQGALFELLAWLDSTVRDRLEQ